MNSMDSLVANHSIYDVKLKLIGKTLNSIRNTFNCMAYDVLYIEKQ